MLSVPSPTLVSYTFDGCNPCAIGGEIIAFRLSQDLFGPGSEIATRRNLPSGSTRYNYHRGIVIGFEVDENTSFIILPVPAYSSTDPLSGLSSTSWLLAQPEDFQQLHIPVPYEEDPTCTHPHPPFPTPSGFGDPLEIGGWKDSKPSWVQALPQKVKLGKTTTFQRFQPPVKISRVDIWRLMEHSRIHSIGRTGESSFALKSLYANDAIKIPRELLAPYPKPLDSELDFHDEESESESESDGDWNDCGLDPISYLRHFATNPMIAELIQEHDQKVLEQTNQRIASWLNGISTS